MLDLSEKDEKVEEESEFERMFGEQMKEFKEGDVVKGTIVEISGDAVVVDIGYKSEGVVSAKEFPLVEGKLGVEVGDEIKVFIERREDDNGFIVLSKTRADQLKLWDTIEEACDNNTLVDGTITNRVKGGFYVNIGGLNAFLPGSQVDLKPVRNPDSLLGQTFSFNILKYNKRKSNIIVSRRAILEKEREVLRKVTFEKLEEGAILDGVVKNITDYGAFVDLGGIDGLVHLTDMSWGKVSHPTQFLKIGDTISVKVLRFDKEDNKISLGIKQTKPDPWQTVTERYPVGTKATGRVVNITDYGAFVELEEGFEGLVHISQMSWTKIRHPSQKLKVDDEVTVQVLNVDQANRRISLGIKQVEPNPWEGVSERYPKGTRVKGIVKNITDFGIFLGVEDGIDGLVHISDLSWTKVKHPSELFRKGQEAEAIVLHIDSVNRRFSLSTKLLEKNPWEGVEERYKPGTIVEGKITGIADFGAFVLLEEGLEGLIHVSEISRGSSGAPDISVGDTVVVEVLNVDSRDNKIGLSLKEVSERTKAAPAAAEEAEGTVSPEAEILTEVIADAKATVGEAAPAEAEEEAAPAE
ncbi:MAG: 30S ribosomal protein S1, partial [Thermodesulfobacteriota bacterium]